MFSLGISIYYIHYRALNALVGEIKDGLISNVSASATTLNGDIHKKFRSKEQKKNPDYIAFLKKMEKIRHASKNIRYMYTNIIENGIVYFIANPSPQNDNDGDGMPDEAPQLMEPYKDPGEALLRALKEQITAVDREPYTDIWGTFISAYAPFYDSKGNFAGTLGMDLELKDYKDRIYPIKKATIIASIIGCIFSVFGGLLIFIFINRQLKYEQTLSNKNEELEKSYQIIKKELKEAETYVVSLFPPSLRSIFPPPENVPPVFTDWIYQSSSDLGGDTFGYHWIDEENFAMYLLDVCGHGVGAALHSVTVVSSIKNMILPDVDFLKPSGVLEALNNTFPMEKHNFNNFSIWYGVYNIKTHELRYSSGGHPPAILIQDHNTKNREIRYLRTAGIALGSLENQKYKEDSIKIDNNNRLYIFSDGVYEIDLKDSSGMMTLEEFAAELNKTVNNNIRKVEAMLEYSRKAQKSEHFEDDFTLMEIKFQI